MDDQPAGAFVDYWCRFGLIPEWKYTCRSGSYLIGQGCYQYAVVLAEDLGRQPRLKNAQLVLKHGRQPLTFELLEHARRLFEGADCLLWNDVLAGRYAPLAINHVCRLILDNYLFLDLDQQIGPLTAIKRIPGGQLKGAIHE